MARKINTVTIKKKSETIKYAKVSARLADFRTSYPHAKITTEPIPQPDGGMIFRTTIVKDKSDEFSAESTGSAYYSATEMKNPKSFEKLESISVGRALALLGYLNDGEIATGEEMEEFEEYKRQKTDEEAREFISKLEKSKTLAELQTNFVSGVNKFKENQEVIAEIIKVKNELKGVLK